MALTLANLQKVSVGTSANPSVWTYTTSENITDVDASNYWGTAPGEMKASDIIHCNCADGFVTLGVTAIDVDAATSTVAAIGSGGNGGQVWVGPITCTAYGTAGKVGSFVSPIGGTILKWKHITDTVVTVDNVLNLDVGGTNATGSITVAVSDTAADIIDSATVSANGAVTEGALVKIESDGAGDTGAGRVWVLIQP